MNRFLVFSMILITAMSAATAYQCNSIVEQVQVTEQDRQMVAAAIPAIRHFQMLSDKAVELAIAQARRAQVLEKYITDMGLPLPAGPFPKPEVEPGEKIVPIDVI